MEPVPTKANPNNHVIPATAAQMSASAKETLDACYMTENPAETNVSEVYRRVGLPVNEGK